MKTIVTKLICLLLLFLSWNIQAFEEPEKEDNIRDLKSFNIFGLGNYFIKGEVTNENLYTFTLYESGKEDNENSNVSFSLRPLTKEAFIKSFFASIASFKSKIGATEVEEKVLPEASNLVYEAVKAAEEKTDDYVKLEEEASKLFFMFIAGSIVSDDLDNKPKAGEICFYDKVKILRKDYNDKPFKSRLDRLWDLYKKDMQIVKVELDAGRFDDHLGLSQSNYSQSKKDSSILQIQKALGLSGKFEFAEIVKFLNRREFNKKKSTELLQNRANAREAVYSRINEQLDERNEELISLIDPNGEYELMIRKIDSLNTIEENIAVLNANLETAYNNILQQLVAPTNDLFDLLLLAFNRKLYSGIEVDIDSYWEVINQTNDDFTSCILKNDSINCGARTNCLEKSNAFAKAVNEAKEKMIDLRTETEKKLNSLIVADSQENNADTIELYKADISYLQEMIDLISPIPSKISKVFTHVDNYCKTAKDIIERQDNQIDLAKTIKERTYRDQILPMLENRDDRPIITDGITSVPEYLNNTLEDRKIFVEARLDQLLEGNRDKTFKDGVILLRKDVDTKLGELSEKDLLISKISALETLDSKSSEILDKIKFEVENAITTSQEIQYEFKEIIKSVQDASEEKIEAVLSEMSDLETQLIQQEDLLIYKDLEVEEIILEINEGFVENIMMTGTVKEHTDKYGNVYENATPKTRRLKFENLSPIGFSRKQDFDALKEKKLSTRGGDKTQYEVYLEDVINIYIQEHQVGRRDYSPANQIVRFTESEDLCMDLEKDATYRLFEAQIFSDFVGLDQSEPNGLIQTEINKRINILTSRAPFKFFSIKGMRNEWNIGGLSFVEPSLKISKVEDNNRALELSVIERSINNTPSPIKYASTLSLKQFENFSAGIDANILLLDMPNFKSTLYQNWGVRYGRTAIQDLNQSTTNGNGNGNAEEQSFSGFGVNTFGHFSETIWSVFEDERYSLSMSYQHHWFYLRDNRFLQVANAPVFGDSETNPVNDSNEFNTVRLLISLEPTTNNKGRLFFRYTYNWQQGFWRTGFHQAQVGYSFFLLGRQTK